jgi:beta-glucanase (GH16 family)
LHWILILLSCLCFGAVKANPPIAGQWKLVFEDNFEKLNSNIWTPNREFNKVTLGKSKCFFLKENVEVKSGNLILISKKEDLELTNQAGLKQTKKFSSGFIQSFRKFSFRYGYIEARIKLPRAKGLWPAFWLMPDRSINKNEQNKEKMRSTQILESNEIISGKGMEIDIMETLSEWKEKKINTAAHWDGYGENLKSINQIIKKIPGQDSEGYRRYGLLWEPNLLVWFINDQEIFRWQNERIADVPMYMIFSTNVGGWATNRIQKKKLPDYTFIDYVRVWQRAS